MLGIVLIFLAFAASLAAGFDNLFSGKDSQAAIFFFCSFAFLCFWAYIFWLRLARQKSGGKRGD